MYPADGDGEPEVTSATIASDLKAMCRPGHPERGMADSMNEYWRNWLRACADMTPNETREMPDGSTAGYSVICATHARFFCEVYRMACNRHDPDEYERDCARSDWDRTAASGWDALWKRLYSEEQLAFANVEKRRSSVKT